MAKFADDLKAFNLSFLAVGSVAVFTVVMLLIGQDTIGQAVVALVYLIPIVWSTSRWGSLAGIAAALTASLAFDFFFIPPFNTLNIGSLEGWLVLVIFLLVSILVITQIQAPISRAKTRERVALTLYELVAALACLPNREAVARTVGMYIQQSFQAALVKVSLAQNGQFPSVTYSTPPDKTIEGRPTRLIPITVGQEFAGEISIWQGNLPLPPDNDWLLHSFSRQIAMTLERVTS